MVQIANYFNVPVAYLLTEDESLLEKEKPATEVTGKSDSATLVYFNDYNSSS